MGKLSFCSSIESICLYSPRSSPASIHSSKRYSVTDDHNLDASSASQSALLTPRWSLISDPLSADLDTLMLSLNSLTLSQSTLLGSVHVQNLAFEKQVSIKYSYDHWLTTHEMLAYYHGPLDPRRDDFRFELEMPKKCPEEWIGNMRQRHLSFCIKYSVNGEEHWDNNQGKDYQFTLQKLTCPKTVTKTRTEEEGDSGSRLKLPSLNGWSPPKHLRLPPRLVKSSAKPIIPLKSKSPPKKSGKRSPRSSPKSTTSDALIKPTSQQLGFQSSLTFMMMAKEEFSVGILIVSDRVSTQRAIDLSGPILENLITNQSWHVKRKIIVPDEIIAIQRQVMHLIWIEKVNLILTSGGTGFSPRDVTPEAIAPLLERQAPGLIHAMLSKSLSITPLASLSRPVCGTIKDTVILTLPGSPKGAKENLEAIIDVLPHAMQLATNQVNVTQDFHQKMHASQRHHVCRHDPVDATSGPLMPLASVADRHRKSPFPLISFENAMKSVLDHSILRSEITLPVGTTLVGHVLSRNITAPENIPTFRASVVDGYAVIASDGPGTYPLVSVITAGDAPCPNHLEPGQLSRITTGAPLPPGADAVVMVEATSVSVAKDGEESLIQIHENVIRGQDVREIGSDVFKGELVMSKGDVLSSSEIGLLASLVVAVLSSGNEILDVQKDSASTGKIFDSNRPALLSLLASLDHPCLDLGIVHDDPETLTSAIKAGLEKADVLITTGGVSMGEKDHFKGILERDLSAKIHFGRVLLKPGKPTTFATLEVQGRQKLVFSLPGNPVSALGGLIKNSQNSYVPPLCRACSEENVGQESPTSHFSCRDPRRPEFQRAFVEILQDPISNQTRFLAHGTGFQRSSRLMSMKSANALIQLPSQKESGKDLVHEGELVSVILIGSLFANE